MSEKQNIRFRIAGAAFDDGMPVHLVSNALLELQSLLDKPYLLISGKNRISHRDRKAFQVLASNIHSGSFEADIQILMQAAHLALPATAASGADTIWEYSKETWRFLKLIYERFKDEEKPTIVTKDNGKTNVVYGDNNVIFNGPVTILANKSMSNYQRLNHLLNKRGIDEISLGDASEPEIIFNRETKDLFRVPSNMNQSPVEITCDFFNFNKYQKGGKLAVRPGQEIPEGEYSFSIMGNQDQVQYISSMLKPEIRIQCIKEEKIDPLGGTKIVRLHVVDIVV